MCQGLVRVCVVGAEGLGEEWGRGWRNPVAVVRMGNTRLQTRPCRNTEQPHWNKTFTM